VLPTGVLTAEARVGRCSAALMKIMYGTMLRLFSSTNSATGISSTSASVTMSTARCGLAPSATLATSRSKCFTTDCNARMILVFPSLSMIRTLSLGTNIRSVGVPDWAARIRTMA